jgi:hypothetical protein
LKASPLAEHSTFAKLVAIFAIAFVIGLGLCGVLGPLNRVSVLVTIFSAVGLVMTLVVRLFAEILGGFESKDSEPQRLFDDTHKDDKDR